MAMRVMREKRHNRWKKNLADIFDVIIFNSLIKFIKNKRLKLAIRT